ncbi:gamma-glutamyltransferase [Cohnella yongneupensis]|uniref:Glutathione hydrolase proenzyme n=1 Tax=Cohnella yongneupensis TaxID=425006 RepID=A0ABW0QX97_9BACL
MKHMVPPATKAMVASPHTIATEVGASILKRGGNAFDAAVAVSAALGVVYPHMTGVGGDAFFMLYNAGKGELTGYNGSGRSGARASTEFYAERGLSSIPARGALSAVTAPGMVDAWWEVWSAGGKLPWAELLQPAIAYAENGFPISRSLQEWLCRDERYIRACSVLSDIYLPGGLVLAEGEPLVQRELARTLRELQAGGREAFYCGSLTKRIVDGIRADGGVLALEDFVMHVGQWVDPIKTSYRGYEIFEMPPNSQGFTALMMMKMLERFGVKAIPRHSAEFYHLMVEATKLAFQDRDRYLTDPDFSAIPLERLLSLSYLDELAGRISMERAGPSDLSSMGQDTAYAAVVDEEGNCASFIQSLYYDFGSCYMPADTGIILQNRGSYFSLDPSHVNCLQPGKRTFHTLMPAMIMRDGLPYALLGTQGGEGQPQTQLSLMTGILDYDYTIEEAISLPRWVYGRTWGQDSDSLKIEGRVSEAEVASLRERGHKVDVLLPWDGAMGQAQGIVIDRARGCLHGAADPRGDGSAMGW